MEDFMVPHYGRLLNGAVLAAAKVHFLLYSFQDFTALSNEKALNLSLKIFILEVEQFLVSELSKYL